MAEIVLKVSDKDKQMWDFWLRRRYFKKAKLTTLIVAAVWEAVRDQASKSVGEEGYSENKESTATTEVDGQSG